MEEGFREKMAIEEISEYLKMIPSRWKTLYKIAREVKIHNLKNKYYKNYIFATHIIESKIDLKYIQELSGNKSSKTIENCTHASRKNLSAIKIRLIAFYQEVEYDKRTKEQ